MAVYFFTGFIVHGFEVFSEQQLLVLDDPTRVVNFNNSESGSTHVDDYWAKIDLNYSPLEGWSLARHVRIGCFLVQWESPLAYAERISEVMTATECVQFCNKTQAYLQLPLCRCGLDESLLPMTEVLGGCSPTSWEVFREYDYRSSMSPSTYDVSRRLLYSIVTVRLPSPADPPIRNYIHAVNALESRPEFSYDVRLDRMLFNAVWDFGQSRMVALSLSDWGGTLDFSVVSYNSSLGQLQVQQSHFPIEDEIVATGELVRDGLASAEGLGTVDVLFGTYYTVVPATVSGSTQVVHVILAVDIDMKRVLTSVTLPVTLVNIQINSLNHELYGAGADLTGQYAYYHLCTSTNLTQTVNGITTRQISVGCTLAELGELPTEVNYLYLQSAAIDHQNNYAWFTYKEDATGRPRILEYHQDSKDYVIWPQDSLPENAVFSSLIQTAPRIFFALFPPSLLYARFNAAGTKLFLSFDAATLRGAAPIDTNADDIPDSFNEADKATRAPCEDFIDQFTMTLIPGSMCQWTSDADFYIEIDQSSTIAPGDLARLKPGTVYRGEQLPSGAYQFSQPSSDFAIVEPPLEIPTPVAEIGGMRYIDVCTDLTLDGTQSRNHGYRGTFTWALSSTNPVKPEPHIRQLQKVIDDEMLAALPVAAQVLRIPQFLMQAETLYNFSLTVQSYWNPSLTDTAYFSVMVSSAPVPPMEIFGSYSREIKVENPFSLVSEIVMQGCSENLGNGSVGYRWTVCKRTEAVLVQGSILGCNYTFGSGIDQSKFSGVQSRSLYVQPFALEPLDTYIFTVFGQVNITNGTSVVVLQNVVSAEVKVVLGGLSVTYYGGNGFSSRRDRAIVVDFSDTTDFSDPSNLLSSITYTYSCYKQGTMDPCFAGQGSGPTDISLLTTSCIDVPDPFSNPAGQPLIFEYRDKDYNHAEGVSYPPLSNVNQFCIASPTSLIFQSNLFEPGEYVFVTNASKVVNGVERVSSTRLYVTVLAPSTASSTRNPLIAVFLESPAPVFPGSTIRLRGEVTNPQNATTYSFVWTAYRFGLNPDYNAEMASADPTYAVEQYAWAELSAVEFNKSDPQQVRSREDSKYMVIAPDVLWPGATYKLRLTALDSFMESQDLQDANGYAEYTFRTVGLPPSGGVLSASNLSGIALETEFLFSLDGWGSEDRPLLYQFSYIQDFDSPFAEPVELTIAFSDRNYVQTRLPEGLVGTQHLLRVVGTVQSATGAVAVSSVDVSVSPASQTGIEQLAQQVPKVDPETAILYTTLLAETPATPTESMPTLAQVVEGKMFAADRAIAGTPEMVSSVAHMLTAIADAGAVADSVVSFLNNMVNLSVDLGYISADGSLGSSEYVDVANSLFSAIDAITPGVVPSYENATARRLKGGRGMGGMVPAEWPRRLQTVETRSAEEMYNHFQIATALVTAMSYVLHVQLYPGEAPISFALRGQDIYLGKDFSSINEAEQSNAPITTLFDTPSLERPGMPEIHNYRYVQFKKFPYDFLVMPANHTLEAPPSPNDTNPAVASLVPPQTFNVSERLWHAVMLKITDEAGNDSLIDRSLVNATFSILPRIAAYDATNFGNVLNPSTCYWIDLGNGNFSAATFDSRGSIFNEDSCVTMHTDYFAILADNLASELEIVQQTPGEFLSQYDEEFTTTANVVTATLVLVACAGFVMVSVYVDEHDAANKVTPLDSLKTQVIDRDDPKEKVLGTIFQAIRRNHLVIGWNYFHLRLTRVRRAGIFITAIFATEALAVLQHSLLAFKAESAWAASGLVAAVLVFPIVQFLEFCFEWLPQSRMLTKPPPRSLPAKPIPLKEQAEPKVLKYPKRPAVGKVRPPEPKVLPRAVHSLQLPVMPTLQLSKASGLAKGRPQPPARPPGQLPRPPQGPPPPGHLLARAQSPDSAAPELAFTGFSEISKVAPGTMGPFGLTLPELPPLPQGNLKAIADGKPAPAPPPKGSAGPRPPKTPPPVSKMFFVAPKGVPLAVPALPAPPSNQPRACPALPKLPPARTFSQLSTIRSGGGSPRQPPPPPAPPTEPKVPGLTTSPAATTPRATASHEDMSQRLAGSLPGAVSPEEVVEPLAEDVENEPGRSPQVVRDPEHTMPAPADEASPVRSPNRRRRPVVASSEAALREMEECDLPNIPRSASSKQGSMPLALPKGMRAVSHRDVSAPARSPNMSSPVSLSPGADQSPVRFEGSNLRFEMPKQASTASTHVPPGKHAARQPQPPPKYPPPGGSVDAVHHLPGGPGGPGLPPMPKHPPKPPPKVRGKALLPTPPSGPPPAHAIVLAKGKPQDFSSSSGLQAVLAKAKPPPPLVHPPSEPLPSFVYRASSQAALQAIMDGRENGSKASALEPLPPKAPPLNDTRAFAALPPIVKEYVPLDKGPKPVPEFVVKVSVWTVYLFVFWIFVYSISIIAYYGVYMASSSIWATYAATLCGCLLNFGIFESMKCVILGCVELVKHETVRRQAELDARRTRMVLKEQRLQERRSRSQEIQQMHVQPPLMG